MTRPLLAVLPLLTSLSAQGPGPLPDLGTSVTPPVTLSGIVTDASGPVAGATLHILRQRAPLWNGTTDMSHETEHHTVKTGADGRFSAVAPPWRYASVYATKGDQASKFVDDLMAPVGGVSIVLEATTRVATRLVANGKGIAGHKTRLERITPEKHGVSVRFEATTGVNGELRFDKLPPGLWQLEIQAGDWRMKEPAVFGDGKGPKQINLLPAITLDCQVRVMGPEDGPAGPPVTNARIELIDHRHFYSTVSDMTGRFRLPGGEVGPGQRILIQPTGHAYRVLVTPPGHSPDSPAPQVTVVVPAGRSITGVVTDPRGTPMKRAAVLATGLVHMTGVHPQHTSQATRTGADGRYTFTTLDPSTLYVIRVVRPNAEQQVIAHVRPLDGKKDLGNFRIGSNRIELSLQFADGRPADLSVRIWGPRRAADMMRWRPFVETKKGTWISDCLDEGAYMIAGYSKTYGYVRKAFDYKNDPRQRMTQLEALTLRKMRLISGTVQSANGKPASGVKVSILPAGATDSSGSSDWSDFIVEEFKKTDFPADKYPTSTKTGADGKFSVWCYEASGNLDLVAQPDAAGPNAAEKLTRIDRVTSKTGPFRITLLPK